MKTAYLSLFLVMMTMTLTQAQGNSIGIFANASDVGNPAKKGSSAYDGSGQVYTLNGGGYNIWFNRDEFHYLYNSLKGDFILTANFEFVSAGVDPHRKVGWMVRESLDEEASHMSATLHGDGLTVLQWRELRGAYMRDPEDEIFSPKSNYTIIQLERKGKKLIMRAAHSGEPLQLIGEKKMESLGDEVLAGLFVCSHNPDVVEQAKAWNVRIDQPVSEDYNPYDDGFIGCRMETMNVFDGRRKVIHESDGRFEAPNWMPEGQRLLFNMDGSIYTIPVEGGGIQKLNTGTVQRNNNDHGISFNGKLLAISSHRDGLSGGGSTIYVLPLEGGEPTLVTEKTPSYWHGWNPNNKEVVYVAKRDDNKPYNIYKADIKTGAEIQVTDFEFGHVDGPEYSPDGKYIYYNGSQSGTMQIWRMKPDGSGKEQMTFGKENNWFPHISPDGKWMVYLAFPESVAPGDHPSYKRVTLNLMPANGGPAKVIAYMYGGQGTINVPSWSPDSKHIAFVSNSGKK
jgi:Tol biopolymer transport system component